MSDNDKQIEERELRVQHYMVLLTAWINTKMEHDKTIITLSAAAIGLLITILTAIGIGKYWHIIIFCVAFTGYSVAIFASLIIFQKNSVYIESELRREDETDSQKEGHEHKLERLDKLALWSFIIGTIAFVSIGICTAYSKLKKEEKQMADDKDKGQVKPQGSLEDMKKSFQGLSNLRPCQTQNSSNSNQGHQTGSTGPSNNSGNGKSNK